MAKNKSKADKKSKGKKNKNNKHDFADIISKVIGNLARKSTKKLIKSFEKRAGKLAANVTPGNLLATAFDTAGKNQNKEVKQNTTAVVEE
ncbi:hypothetical protein [Adhaeribacter pallidiroseus]|uniref:Uncharacterized protein n=1 Tax=Adhaeribacter pallidiroseus TaxID=2072847 RepID=A0A369QBC4_9BACT|nr:hypothetical protein [Adhaeribacter pallidiroseus]RDC61630.1 hypothetical protein AHMF7616_00210 [Adhaeribacter pallidiroseus]